MQILKRLIVMAFLGAVGGLLGAVGGEGLFLFSSRAPSATQPPRSLCLVFDLSESMLKRTAESGSQLDALRNAALGFVARQEFQADELSLVGFSSDARVLCSPGAAGSIRDALGGLRAAGLTNIGRGLDVAREVLEPARAEERWILLFTDGKPQVYERTADPVGAAVQAARACREAGIHIVAVGTGLADRALLDQITGDPGSVFISAPEKLGDAFRSSSEVIQNRQMLASTPAAIELEASLQRACGWAALVGLGTGLALVVGHNRHLRRRARPRLAQIALVVVGAGASGVAAGAAGQGTFYVLSETSAFQPALRTLAWILLGSGVVLGMSFFVPNLPRGRAFVGGALGGAGAAACFLRIVPEVGDTPGRLLGALILGLMAGAMTVLVEVTVRRASLVVHWPGGEKSTLLLGAKPIVVGHSASADICPVFDEKREAVVGSFRRTEQGNWYEEKRSGKRRRLRGGDRLSFDPVVVEVREERSEAAHRPAAEAAGKDAGNDERASGRREPEAALPREDRARVRTRN